MKKIRFVVPLILLFVIAGGGFYFARVTPSAAPPTEAGAQFGEPLEVDPIDIPIRTVIVDAGHGGKDPGAHGDEFLEKDLNLGIALKVRERIRERLPYLNVHLTRETDEFVELHERGRIAQRLEGDFFISIHCDAISRPEVYGSSVYVLGINPGQSRYRSYIRENQAVLFEDNYRDIYGDFDPASPESYIFIKLMNNVFRQESFRMGDYIHNEMSETYERKSRGVKQAPFIVLWASAMPAVLFETGYITNTVEEQYLGSDAGQYEIADAIVTAIETYNHGGGEESTSRGK